MRTTLAMDLITVSVDFDKEGKAQDGTACRVQAYKNYKVAAKDQDPDALFGLGYMYRKGIHVAKDYAEANHYFALAAEQGNPKAMIKLAESLEQGLGIERNLPKALSLYEGAKAAFEMKRSC
jgi:TPR repeat protein